MKIYYQYNGGIGSVPVIKDLGELKVFAHSIGNIDGNILIHSTQNAPKIFVDEIRDFQPDLILIETFTWEMIEGLRRVRAFYKGPIVGFWGDCVIDRYMLIKLRSAGKYCNLLLVVDKPAELALRTSGINAEFTMQPASAHIYKYEPDTKKEYDIIMAGNAYSSNRMKNAMQRVELVRIFSKRHDFALFGDDSWLQYGIKPIGWINEYELVKKYNQTKIVLSCDSVIDKLYFTSIRTYNVMCCGAFLLIRKFSGIEDLFTNHKHLVWFETNQEAEELADYYLAHDNERNKIALSGMEYVKKKSLNYEMFKKWIFQEYENKQISEITRIFDFFWVMANRILLKLVRSKVAIYLRNNIGFYVME